MSAAFRTRALVALVAAPALAAVPSPAPRTGAGDFPQWRGPDRNGSVASPARAWPPALREAWTLKTGIGHASPVVAGGRVFLFSREGEDEVLRAVDLGSGKELWRDRYPAPYKMNPATLGHGKGPKATPLVSGGRVFAFGIGGVASAIDAASGKLVWRRTFEESSMRQNPEYGVASSPLAVGGAVVFAVGDRDKGALVALDPATGRERWRFSAEGPAYASPVVAEIDRVKQIITLTRTRLISVSADRGSLLWSLPFSTDYDQNSVTPLVENGVVVYSGLSKGVMAVRPVRRGVGFEPHPVWTNSEVAMYMSSPVVVGGKLIGFSHRKKGQFFALDLETGKTLWLSDGRQGENAALLGADGIWMALTDEGRLVVADAASATFQPIRTYEVAQSATWSSPAVSGSTVLVKGVDTLTLWRIQEQRSGE